MNHGIVISSARLLESFAYWKTGKRDPEALLDVVTNKEAYKQVLKTLELDNSIYDIAEEFKRTFGVIFDILRGAEYIFVGAHKHVNDEIFRKLPGEYSTLSELNADLAKELTPQVDEWVPTVHDKVLKALEALGCYDSVIRTYFAGEGGGPYSRNAVPNFM